MKKFLFLAFLVSAPFLPAVGKTAEKTFFPPDRSADLQDIYDKEHQKERKKQNKRYFKQLHAEVRNGYPESMGELARAYYFGTGVKKNYKRAYKYAQKAAQRGDESAAVLQARMLLLGRGTKADADTACAMWEELFQNSNAHAAFQLYAFSNECKLTGEQARQRLDFAAREGVAPAWREKSHLAQENPAQAFDFMERAARLEYRLAQYDLARMYETGTGTQPRPELAFHYMLLAAKQELKAAQWQTAQWYEQGYGTAKSPSLAFHWTRIAAKNNVKEAQKRLAEMFRTGTGTRVNVGQAKKWEQKFRQAAPKEAPEEERY